MDARLKYEDMVSVLVERVPTFSESQAGREVLTEQDRDLPYVVFGSFASFLNELLLRKPLSDSTIQASFQLLNEMGNSVDHRVANLAAVGVFEILTDSPQSIRVARQLLYGRAIDLFENMIQLWGVEVKDP